MKQIYRQVELLHKAGWDAYVLQEQPGFRPDWFSSDAPVLDLETYKASPPSANNDLLVLPETWLTNVPSYLPGIPKVIFNQNAFYSFGLSGACDNRTLDLYRHGDIQAVVTVSNDSRDLLIEGCGIPAERCFALINGIDRQLFSCTGNETPARGVSGPQARGSRPQGGADGQSASKTEAPGLPGTAKDAARGGSQRPAGSLDVSQLRPSGRLRSAVGGGNRLWLPGGGLSRLGRPRLRPAPYEGGGIRRSAGLLKGVEQELARFDAAPEAVIQERLAASEAILQTYSLEAELDCCLRTWAHICP